MQEAAENIFTAHSDKQEQALFCEKRILLLGTGTQYGKTTVGALRMKYKMHAYTHPEDAFIITAPTYKIMMQSTLPPFLKAMEGLGTYLKKDECFKMHRGGTCWLRTETDPDSIVGITNVRHIWGDEAGKYRLYFWENMQARADFCGATIDLTTSPYALNWIWKELIKPFREGKRRDVELIQAPSWENPFHSLSDPVKRSEKRATMDLRRFNMIYGGEWGKMTGLVFDSFDEDANSVMPFALPEGTLIVGGVDWGFTEPFVHIVRAITPEGMHYQISEFYKSGMTPHQQIDLIEQKSKVYGIKRHWCGHEQPGLILELQKRGIPAQAADFDIMRGNGIHYELIKTRKYKIFQGSSPHTIDEYSCYHYPDPVDLGPDDDAKEQKPVGQHDHAMSANRFISIHEARKELKHTPKLPGGNGLTRSQQSTEQRLKALMRRTRGGFNESWSEPDGE